MTASAEARPLGKERPLRSRGYMAYLITMMGLVAIMDQYLAMVKTSAVPYLLEEYGITASRFSWLEALYLISSFAIFALNGLNDIIGRRWSILVLILIMGGAALGILVASPTLHLFMVFYALAIFASVSNMWSIPVSEESEAATRAKNVSVVYVIGLIPLQAILPPILVDTLGLNWRWMFGVMAVFMVPLLVMWFFMKETKRYDQVEKERRQGTRRRHILGLGVLDKRDLRYIIISASIWLCWLVFSVLYYWGGYYFMTIHGYTLSQWSMVLLGTLLAAMSGGFAGGWLMDRIGRKRSLIYSCLGLSVFVLLMGFARGFWLPTVTIISGFFVSFAYTWIVVFIPEIFPTERRGTCMGWTTTAARISYVVGPAIAAVLLKVSPTMEYFWVTASVIALLPIAIIAAFNPYETKTRNLEQIEAER